MNIWVINHNTSTLVTGNLHLKQCFSFSPAYALCSLVSNTFKSPAYYEGLCKLHYVCERSFLPVYCLPHTKDHNHQGQESWFLYFVEQKKTSHLYIHLEYTTIQQMFCQLLNSLCFIIIMLMIWIKNVKGIIQYLKPDLHQSYLQDALDYQGQ